VDFLAVRNSPELLSAKTSDIYQTMLRESPAMREGNFRLIETDDLRRLFHLYDNRFFGDWLSRTVIAKTKVPLKFRLSKTMTRAGGKTIRTRYRFRNGDRKTQYEIAVATRMLFMNFTDTHRPVTVGGLVCNDRLQALQRIMEHEIVHLAEMLVWGKSSCSASRFKTIIVRLFGHTDNRHDLITSREIAAVRHAVKIGSRVKFEFDGKQLAGFVNRIHHRATVLVEARDGMRYRNGKSYRKYYIPLPQLRVAE
jgi:hypothetical protein